MSRWIVGISGASGTVYARRLLDVLAGSVPGLALDVVISDGAKRVFLEEDGLNVSSVTDLLGRAAENVKLVSNKDLGASCASGSNTFEGMVIVPCSMATVAAVAHGFGDTLIRRAAGVTLKERRRLIIVPRETPLSAVDLENMLRLAQLGVSVVPAMPAFYHKPQTVDDIVDMLVMRITDQMGFRIDLAQRWSKE